MFGTGHLPPKGWTVDGGRIEEVASKRSPRPRAMRRGAAASSAAVSAKTAGTPASEVPDDGRRPDSSPERGQAGRRFNTGERRRHANPRPLLYPQGRPLVSPFSGATPTPTGRRSGSKAFRGRSIRGSEDVTSRAASSPPVQRWVDGMSPESTATSPRMLGAVRDLYAFSAGERIHSSGKCADTRRRKPLYHKALRPMLRSR